MSGAQCSSLGLSSRAVQKLARQGVWRRVLPGVYMPRPVPESWWASAKAATLWGGEGAVLCGRAAARARGLPGFGEAEVEVAGRYDKRHGSISVHRYPALPLTPVEVIRSVPVICVESMAFEICRSASYRVARRAVAYLVREGLSTDHRLGKHVAQIGGKGMHGTRWIRAILEERVDAPRRAETDAEIRFAQLAAGWGWDPLPQHTITLSGGVRRRFDFAFPSARLGVEIDGGIHLDVGVSIEDREKDEAARRAGWTVLRFSNEDVWYRPDYVKAAIAAALAPSLGQDIPR